MKKISPKGMITARSGTGSEAGAPAAPSAQPRSDVPQLHFAGIPSGPGPQQPQGRDRPARNTRGLEGHEQRHGQRCSRLAGPSCPFD